jgi:hypothetical protein
VLPCTRVLVVGVTSFREREQVPSLLSGGGVWFLLRCVLAVVALSWMLLHLLPTSPFITSKGRGQVTFAIK